jgi:hypothetical protein
MARYSDHGKVSLAACDTSVDLKRIDEGRFLGTLLTRIVLRDRQCTANDDEGRKEEVAITVVQ